MTMVVEVFEPSEGRQRKLNLKLAWGGGIAAALAVLGLGYYALVSSAASRAERAASRSADSTGQAAATGPAPSSPPANLPAGASAVGPDGGANVPEPTTVQVTLRAFPGVHASVTMGKTRLGSIGPRAPLVLERRRDSGPLDLVVRSPGYITVHTRVYTFSDNAVDIRLTPLDKKNTLYGYREPLPPEDDAGTPPPAAVAAPDPAPPEQPPPQQ